MEENERLCIIPIPLLKEKIMYKKGNTLMKQLNLRVVLARKEKKQGSVTYKKRETCRCVVTVQCLRNHRACSGDSLPFPLESLSDAIDQLEKGTIISIYLVMNWNVIREDSAYIRTSWSSPVDANICGFVGLHETQFTVPE